MAKSTSLKNEMVEELIDLQDLEMDDDLFDELDDDNNIIDFEMDEEDEPVVSFTNKALPTRQRKVQKPVIEEIEFENKPTTKTKTTTKQTTVTKKKQEPIVIKAEKPNVSPKKEKTTKQPTGKTRVRSTTTTNSDYETIFSKVTEKVDKYNSIMEERENGKSAKIPQSVVISKELLNSLFTARFTESNDSGLKLAMIKAMVSMGFDREDVVDAVSNYTFKKVESELIYNAIIEVLYEVLSSGAGVPLFKTDDCNCSLKGQWTKDRLSTNEFLKTDKASYISSYLKVTTNSPAPLNKKVTGQIKGGKFIPDTNDEE